MEAHKSCDKKLLKIEIIFGRDYNAYVSEFWSAIRILTMTDIICLLTKNWNFCSIDIMIFRPKWHDCLTNKTQWNCWRRGRTGWTVGAIL